MTPSHTELLYRGLSLDLEVGKEDKLLRALAGVRSDTGQSTSVQVKGGRLAQALSNLDNLVEGTKFVLGHNLIGFDLPILQALNPNLQLLQLPAVDTLRLNPLAFPRNPYHHLVKHYQDGALRRGRINDPELDARLALDLFKDQLSALEDAPSDLLTAWHWLTTTDGAKGFARAKDPPGGECPLRDPVAHGRVQIVDVGETPVSQAQAVIAELKRLSSLDPNWNWTSCAVIAREWNYLDPVRSLCELEDIPVQMANEEFSGVWHLRETRCLRDWVRGRESKLVKAEDVVGWLTTQPKRPWWDLLGEAVSEYELETGGAETPVDHFIEWLAEWAQESRRCLVLLLAFTELY